MIGPYGGLHLAGHGQGMLFGRDRELGLVQASLERACAGQGELVLISGEAGIGKTSLVRAVSEHASANEIHVHTSSCYDLSVTPPYGAWAEIFAEFDLAINLPPQPDNSNESTDVRSTSQDALFADTLDVLSTAAQEQPRVLVLEDLHWSDIASLEFLRYLARHLGSLQLLIIATYRDNEIDRLHPLHANLPSLIRESNANRISLKPLDESQIADLVEHHYPLAINDRSRLVSYLASRTEGNPLFIGELLRSLEESNVLELHDDRWSVEDLRQIPVPDLIRQLIDSRLETMDAQSRRLLSIGAAIGQDIDIDIWAAVSGADEQRLNSAVSDAINLSLLEENFSSRGVRFTHALIREALYHDLALPERRSLHRAIAEAGIASRSGDPDSIAYHLVQAQDDRAVEWLMIAGERAQQLYAWRTAAERFTTVLDLIGEKRELAIARGWLCYRVGLLLTYADPEDGIRRMQEAEQIASIIGDDRLRAFAQADRGLLRCLTGDVRKGLADMRDGVAAIDQLEPEDLDRHPTNTDNVLSEPAIKRGAYRLVSDASRINVRQGPLVFWLAWAGRYRDAINVGESFVERADGSAATARDSLGDALAGLGHAYAALGRAEEALAGFSSAREHYGAIDHHFKVGNTAIYELSEAFLPYRADRIMEREWLADQAEAG